MKTRIFALILAFTGMLAIVVPASAQGPTNITITQVDATRFPQIDVYISVTDTGGNAVRGIAPNVFKLEENGQPMQLVSAMRAGEQGPTSTVLLIDHSGSMAHAGKMDGAKQAATTYVNMMRPGDRTAIIQFDTEIETIQAFTDDKNALYTAIQKLVPRGNTSLYDATAQAARYFETTTGRKSIILLTDGMDTSSKLNRQGAIQQATKTGYSIYTIGLGVPGSTYGNQDGIDESSLRDLAQASYGEYFYATDANALNGLYQTLSLRIQNEYRLTYITATPFRDGVKRNLAVTAPGSAASTNYNPGGIIPESAPQWSSWILFLGILAMLAVLLLAPTGLRLASGHASFNLPTFSKPTAKPRIKLSASNPNEASVQPTPKRSSRIRIVKKTSAQIDANTTLPWDEKDSNH